MSADVWPPDWRAQQAESLEAAMLALGVTLAGLEDAEALLEAHGFDSALGPVRDAGARIRTARNEMRAHGEQLRVALDELATQ